MGGGSRALVMAVLVTVLACEALAQEPAGESPPAVPEKAGALDRPLLWTGSGEQALSQAFPDSAVWLELESGERALALFHPETRLPPFGAVVVLADVGHTAASGVTSALAESLAGRGWAVLALGLEAPSPVLRSILMQPVAEPLTDRADTDEAGAPAQSVMIDVMAPEKVDDLEQRYRSRVSQALGAAVAVLAERGYRAPALVGIGEAAGHVAGHALEHSEARAVIWVAPRFYPSDRQTLPERLGALRPPLLELYPSRGASNAGFPEPTIGFALRRDGVGNIARQPIPWLQPPLPVLGDTVASRIASWLASL